MKFAFFGYDFFASSLAMLLADGHELDALFSYEVDGLYNRNVDVVRLATAAKAPIHLSRPTRKMLQRLLSLDCRVIIAAAYPYRLPIMDAILQINVHPSPLPEGRGPWPLPYAILNELPEWGVTIHRMSDDFDNGPIISQQRFPLLDFECLETLSSKCRISAMDLLREFMNTPEQLYEQAMPQGAGSYWPFPLSSEWHLDWTMPIKQIDRIVRAFGKLESTCEVEGSPLVVRDARVWPSQHQLQPGNVVARSLTEIVVAASDGFVLLRDFAVDPSPTTTAHVES